MPEQSIKDKTAIVGIGWTAFSRKSGVYDFRPSPPRRASRRLRMRGCKSRTSMEWFHSTTGQPEGQMVRELVRALGLKKCNFEIYSDGGGGWNCGAVLSGAMLVHSGICKNVLVFKARNRYSRGARRARGAGQRRQGRRAVHHPFRHPPCRRFFRSHRDGSHGALRHDDPRLCSSRRHRA